MTAPSACRFSLEPLLWVKCDRATNKISTYTLHYDRQTRKLVYCSDDGDKLQDEPPALTAWLKAFHCTVKNWNNRRNWQFGLGICETARDDDEAEWNCSAQQMPWVWEVRQPFSQLGRQTN